MTGKDTALSTQENHSKLQGAVRNLGFKPMKPRKYGSLKAVITAAVDQAGGVPVVAQHLSKDASTIYNYTDPLKNVYPSLAQAETLTHDLHTTAFAEHFATLAGGVFLQIDADEASRAALLAQLSAEAQVLSGDYFATLIRAIEDGVIDHQENTELRRRLEPLICILTLAQSKLLENSRTGERP